MKRLLKALGHPFGWGLNREEKDQRMLSRELRKTPVLAIAEQQAGKKLGRPVKSKYR